MPKLLNNDQKKKDGDEAYNKCINNLNAYFNNEEFRNDDTESVDIEDYYEIEKQIPLYANYTNYHAKSVAELQKKSKLLIDIKSIDIKPKLIVSRALKLYPEALNCYENGDEENAYIMFYEYFQLFEFLKKSKVYLKNKSYLDSMLNPEDFENCMTFLEKLADSLEKQYEIKSLEERIKNEPKIENAPKPNLQGLQKDISESIENDNKDQLQDKKCNKKSKNKRKKNKQTKSVDLSSKNGNCHSITESLSNIGLNSNKTENINHSKDKQIFAINRNTEIEDQNCNKGACGGNSELSHTFPEYLESSEVENENSEKNQLCLENEILKPECKTNKQSKSEDNSSKNDISDVNLNEIIEPLSIVDLNVKKIENFGKNQCAIGGNTESSKYVETLEVENKNLKKSQQFFEKENQSLKESKFCKICMDNEINIVLVPCGHFISCDDCASCLKFCPMCRRKINVKVKTYMS